MEKRSFLRLRPSSLVLGAAVLAGLYLARMHSYLLFHSLAEIFSVAVAGSVFMVVWSARRSADNPYFLFVGIAYLSAGILDAVHMLAYKGMGVFPVYEANRSTQLWIAARYLQAASLAIAPVFAERTLNHRWALTGYAAATGLLLAGIFYGGIFPDCFVEGTGLTPFKIYSEYVICGMLVASIVFLERKKDFFCKDVLRLLVASLAVAVFSELSFTLYKSDVYGFFNLLGHYLKIVSLFLVYRALVATDLARKADMTDRLEQELDERRRTEERVRHLASFPERNPNPVLEVGPDGRIVYHNPAAQKILESHGMDKDDVRVFLPQDMDGILRNWNRETESVLHREIRAKDRVFSESVHLSPALQVARIYAHDITDRKRAEEEVRAAKEWLERRVSERTTDLHALTERLRGELEHRATVEEDLARQHALLQSVLDSVGDAVIVADQDGRFVFWNPAAARFLRNGATESGPEDWALRYGIYLPDEATPCPADRIPLARAIRGESVDDVELFVRPGPGDPALWVTCSARPLRASDGTARGGVVVFRDITARKQAEEALRKRERQQAAVAELGQRALAGIPLGDLMDELVVCVARVLDVDISEVYEFLPDTGTLLLKAGTGFVDGTVGRATVESGGRSMAGYTLLRGAPVIVSDLCRETRFEPCQVLVGHGAVSGISVPVAWQSRPYGVLGAHSHRHYHFTADDIHFLRSVANILAMAIGRRQAESELSESEERFRTSIENMLDGFAILSAVRDGSGKVVDFRYEYVNESGCRMNRRGRDEQIGRTLLDLLPAHTETGLFEAYAHVVETGEPMVKESFSYEDTFGDAGPLSRAFDVRAAKLGDGFAVAWRDVTDRVRAHEDLLSVNRALRETGNTLKGIIHASPLAIMFLDPEGRIKMWNPAAAGIFGWTEAEVLERFPPNVPEGKKAELLDWLTRGRDGAFFTNVETQRRRKDGILLDVLVSTAPLHDTEAGFLGNISIIADVSDRKRIERALKASEEQFRFLVEGSLVGVLILQDGRVVFRNPEQERLFGALPEGFALKEFADVHPEDAEKFALLCNAVSPGERQGLEMDLRFYPSGKRAEGIDMRWVHCRTIPIEYRGEEAVLVNMVDITRTKEMEQLLRTRETMASLGHVAAGIAHEIRNPLSGINIHLSVLCKLLDESAAAMGAENGQKADAAMEHIRNASGKIESVIRKVMDFSRPTVPRMEVSDLNAAVAEAIDLSRTSLRKRGITLDRSQLVPLPPCHADPQLIAQVLLNLITNAAQALEHVEGPKIIGISTVVAEDHVVISVADSGPGVPASLRRKIFDPFFTTRRDGYGIGLTFCHRVIADHRGTLEVDVGRYGGADFRIELPRGRSGA